MTFEKSACITGISKVPTGEVTKEKITFTHRIMTIVIMLYFLVAILGGILVVAAAVIDVSLGEPIGTSMFVAYAAYIGGPTATAIGFYAWKSKAENILKIQNNSTSLTQKETDTATLVSALANMEGN